jgi:hypothetical protein
LECNQKNCPASDLERSNTDGILFLPSADSTSSRGTKTVAELSRKAGK